MENQTNTEAVETEDERITHARLEVERLERELNIAKVKLGLCIQHWG